MDSESKVRELEAQLAALSAEVEQLRESATEAPAPVASRRGLLKLAGAAAAGAAATAWTGSGQAAALDGAPIAVGQVVSSTTNTRLPTIYVYANSNGDAPLVGGVAGNLFLVRDAPDTGVTDNDSQSPTFPAAVGGYAFRSVKNGLYGYTRQSGYGVVGRGVGDLSVGVYAAGRKANVEMLPSGEAPATRTDAHNAGEMLIDANRDVWVCVTSGSPGTWRKLTGPAAAGSFHALAPSRVYDSRVNVPAPGTLSAGANRTISVAAKRDINSGAVTTDNIVPAGATAIACNVTAVNTVAAGFLTLNPGGTTTTDGATVNWSGAGQILNNGVIVKLNDQRQVTIVCGGTAATRTDVVVDVTGYFL